MMAEALVAARRSAGVPAMNDKPIAAMTIEEARDELRLGLRVDMETLSDLGTASTGGVSLGQPFCQQERTDGR